MCSIRLRLNFKSILFTGEYPGISRDLRNGNLQVEIEWFIIFKTVCKIYIIKDWLFFDTRNVFNVFVF